MAFITLSLLSIILLAAIVRCFLALRRNIELAQKIGLPYIIVPWYTVSVPWFILAPVVNPILNHCLPTFMTRSWLKFMDPFWTWRLLYSPFHERENDTIVSVSPGALTFNTCSPEIISQLGAQRKDFGKPVEVYTILETFGPNLVTTDGPHWKHQRRIIQPSFNEASNVLAWDETIFQTTALIRKWDDEMKRSQNAYLNFHDDLRTLALHVVVRGSFGLRMFWPGVEKGKFGEGGVKDEGQHRMSLGQATLAVVNDLKWLFVLPSWALKWAPSKYLNKIWLGYGTTKWERTWKSTSENGKRHIDKDNSKDMEQTYLVFSPVPLPPGSELTDISDSLISTTQKPSLHNSLGPSLTQQEIMSNVFNSLTAGHETTGATLFYCLVNLAMHPSWQVLIQQELDTLFGDRDPRTWTHAEDMRKLQHSKLDAAVLETLRLFPPNNLIPKQSSFDHTSFLRYKGKEVQVPSNTRILILIASVHRNPHYWPPPHTAASSAEPVFESEIREDTNDFRPERWFVSRKSAERYGGRIVPSHDNGIDVKSEEGGNERGFFVPCKGAFVPWSIGERQCIGRNFAHIELMVAIAVILKEWSVELVLGHTSGIEDGDEENKGGRWEEARDRAEKCLRFGMRHYITMQLGKGLIPLRIVRRGSKGLLD
ncbi:hypothetical protein EG329_001713 [Mollisiaceae sp. DMI_Dod_QoI]|nr:hypothetical protein EG329_001713 [Helotiales sp. DMI_Dod_QoI]